jgi:ribosomal-protein-alanine N-acetyltransferase
VELQRLRSDHAAAVLDFEWANRAYFASSVSDRGDEFFAQFDERHRELLAEQDTGVCAFYVLVDEDGAVVGRFNFYGIGSGMADVGYRLAEEVTGRGLATSVLRQLCRLAAEQCGLTTLNAKVRDDNAASRRVLEKAGFVRTGSAEVSGRPGTSWVCRLDSVPARPGVVGSKW